MCILYATIATSSVDDRCNNMHDEQLNLMIHPNVDSQSTIPYIHTLDAFCMTHLLEMMAGDWISFYFNANIIQSEMI